MDSRDIVEMQDKYMGVKFETQLLFCNTYWCYFEIFTGHIRK
jgi:hypothetical protein